MKTITVHITNGAWKKLVHFMKCRIACGQTVGPDFEVLYGIITAVQRVEGSIVIHEKEVEREDKS